MFFETKMPMFSDTSIVFSRGSSPVGDKASFDTAYNTLKDAGENPIIFYRACEACVSTHKSIYYKRLGNFDNFSPYDLFVDHW